jgi:hypothetical protein
VKAVPFKFNLSGPSIVRCTHEGPITSEDRRQFQAFLTTVDAKLLIDLSETSPFEMMQLLCSVQAMLPCTALFGPPPPRLMLEGLPGKDHCRNELRHFATEQEALAWLREGAQVNVSAMA